MTWQKGQSGNPKGRPPRQEERDFLDMLIAAVTPADWKAIVAKAKGQARGGNPVARKWLSDYLIGLPVQRTEITGANGGPIEVDSLDAITIAEAVAILGGPNGSPGSGV